MRIIIGADLVPTDSNSQLFKEEKTGELIGQEIEALLKEADFMCFNLETPLTDQLSPIKKLGPTLSAMTDTIAGIKKLNPYFFTLANNHIFDQGPQGVLSTMDVLRKNGISFAGAGKNLSDARKPFIYDVNGKKIGIYCCSEHEFSIAGENQPGANPFDPMDSLDHVSALRSVVDYVIVMYHGGKEHYRYPTPRLQNVCRKLIDKGANLVVCQHSHCIGCKEEWKGGTIIYGQGNFLFDHSEDECWKTSLLIDVDLCETPNISFHPLVKTGNTVRLAHGAEAEKILSDFTKRSEEIKQKNFIASSFAKLAYEVYPNYIGNMNSVTTQSLLFKAVNKLSRGRLLKKYIKWKMNQRTIASLRNYMECETHRELLTYVLKEEGNSK